MKTIILTGFMGSGKTVVGKWLARRLGWRLMDTDEMIERKAGRTIAQIFKRQGEKKFRQMETAVLKDLAKGARAGKGKEERKKKYKSNIDLRNREGIVLATGGGIVLKAENRKMLKKLGLVVWLGARPEVIIKRVAGQTGRPLLNVPDKYAKIKNLLKARQKAYRAAADIRIDTTKMTVAQVGRKITGELKKRSG